MLVLHHCREPCEECAPLAKRAPIFWAPISFPILGSAIFSYWQSNQNLRVIGVLSSALLDETI